MSVCVWREGGQWWGQWFPVELSCSSDHCPPNVRLQHSIFPSDGTQDRQIMRRRPRQPQRSAPPAQGQTHGPHSPLKCECGILPPLFTAAPNQHCATTFFRERNNWLKNNNSGRTDSRFHLSSGPHLRCSVSNLSPGSAFPALLYKPGPAGPRMCADRIHPNATLYTPMIKLWLLSATPLCTKGLLMKGKLVPPGKDGTRDGNRDGNGGGAAVDAWGGVKPTVSAPTWFNFFPLTELLPPDPTSRLVCVFREEGRSQRQLTLLLLN